MSRFVFPALLALALVAPAATPERGQLDASPTLFTVMAAINAAGYDADLASPNNHPLRAAVRKEIASRHPASLDALQQFFAAHRQKDDIAELSQYISFALSVGGPPDFSIKGRNVDLPPDVVPLEGFGPLLGRFYREAGIEDLWNRSQPAIEQALERYHEPVAGAVLQVNSYLRNPTSGAQGQHFQIYLDLLAAPNQIQTRSYGNDYYVVVTPSLEPRVDDIRHAYLFHLLDPLATRYAEVLMRKKGLADHAQRAPALAEHYRSDFLLLTTASLVKAVESRLSKKPALVGEALREGFILTPYFAEQLPAYEKQEQAMRLYYGDMVKSIDLKREDARLSQVEFASETRVRPAKTAPVAPPPQPTGAARTLEEADQLYAARQLDPAKQGFLKALQQTDDKSLHARAYYGLARIAVLEKDPAAAERLFQKTLEASPDPQTRAWTLVYLGRLSDAAGEWQQAAKYYQAALAVEGASEAARRAAEQGARQGFNK